MLTMYSFLSSNSAIRARLVSWSGVESQSQAVREPDDRNGRYTSSIRQGSDGELWVMLKRLRYLCEGGNKTVIIGDTT